MNAAISNALSIDVEDYFHASALGIPRAEWSKQDQRASANTRELLDLLGERGTKATFFVLGWLAEHDPSLVAAIAAAGHEIACHGYSHQLIYRQSPSEFATETRRAKQVLEDATGQRVRGYRAASFSITERSLWALDVITELGFEYDSSIFPIYHDRYGIRDATAQLHRRRTPSGLEIVEFPPSVLELGPLRLPVAGGGYFRLYPYAVTRWAIGRINRMRGPAVVYLHPWEIDTGQPQPRVGAITRFRHTVNIGKVKLRLRRLLEDFTFEPMAAIVRVWARGSTKPGDGQTGAEHWAASSSSS